MQLSIGELSELYGMGRAPVFLLFSAVPVKFLFFMLFPVTPDVISDETLTFLFLLFRLLCFLSVVVVFFSFSFCALIFYLFVPGVLSLFLFLFSLLCLFH